MSKLNFYTNTDTVDIDSKQIGVSSGGDNREFTIGVRHNGTKKSVKKATKIADIIARALNDALASGELEQTVALPEPSDFVGAKYFMINPHNDDK